MDTLKFSAEELAEAGVPNAALEAEVLLCEVLGKGRAELFAEPNAILDDQMEKAFLEKLSQRKEGVPLSYVAGKAYFRYLDLEVRPGVLIPRPETELLVEEVKKWIANSEQWTVKRKKTSDHRLVTSDEGNPQDQGKTPSPLRGERWGKGKNERRTTYNRSQATGNGPRILDIGTGSGAIALSLVYEIPDAQVTGVDVSEAALKIAANNARKHGLQSRVKLMRSNIFEGLGKKFHRFFDVIVSNPPYIESDEISKLQCEVKDFEPREALDGGPDGLDFYRRILSQAHLFLREGGLIALEIGFGQAETVAELIETAGCYGEVTIIADYAGIDRIILAEKSADDRR